MQSLQSRVRRAATELCINAYNVDLVCYELRGSGQGPLSFRRQLQRGIVQNEFPHVVIVVVRLEAALHSEACKAQ